MTRPAKGAISLRRLVFGLGALCVLCGNGSTLRADEFSQTARYSVRMFSGGTLTLETRTGDIRIEAWDEPRLEIEAEKVVRAGSEAKAKPLYGKIQVSVEGQDKDVHLRTLYPPRRPWRPFRDESKLSVNLRIRMPYDANLVLKCVDGDVTVSGLTAREQLRVNYGDVEIDLPSAWDLRSLRARAWLGYVQSDLQGTEQDSAGVQQKVSFWNARGKQDVAVDVHMGGVWVYSQPQ